MKWKKREYTYDYTDEENLLRYYHFSITYNNYVYFGFGIVVRTNERTNNILKYNPKTCELDSIGMIGDIPSGRTGCFKELVGDLLYIHGGFSKEGSRLNDTYVFNFQTHCWKKIDTKGSFPLKKSGSFGIFHNDYIYLFGGSYGSYTFNYNSSAVDYTNEFHRLDMFNNTWNIIKSINTPSSRSFVHPFIYKGSFYIFGGNDKKNVYNEIYKIDLNKNIYGKIKRENHEKWSDVLIYCK